MADKETVIMHLQIISTWASFARKRDLQFFTAKHLEDMEQWADDAIAMLNEQKQEIEFLKAMQLQTVKGMDERELGEIVGKTLGLWR